MSGANALPPLLCSTPPPIDFGEEDEEDSDLPPLSLVDEEDDGDAFGAFALAANAVRSSNDEDNNSDASVNVPSLPHTPIYKDSPPSFEEHCGRSSISPPPLKAPSSCTDTEENMSQKDNHVKEILANKNVQPIEAFNLNVSLGLNVVSDILTNPSDKDAITKDDKLNLIEPSEADARLTSQKTETLNGTPPAALFTEDVSFGTVINEITRTESDTKTGESCKLTTEEEKLTKEANTDDNQAAFDHLAKPVGNRDDIVLLEDIADDSSDDERHSPKKHKSLLIADENSAEFFAIHRIAGAVGDAEELSNNSHLQAKSPAKTHKHEDEVRAAENENKNEEKEKTIENENEDEDDFDDFACFETSATPTIVTKLHAVHPVFSPSSDENANTFEANFSQYPDFTSAPPPPFTADVDQNQPNQNADWPETITSAILDADTDDDDFQDFCTAPPEVAQPQAGGTTKSCNDHSDTCDDFGDFSEATFGTLSESHTPHTAPTHLTAASHASNLNARLRPALEMMFPTAASDGDNEKTTLPKSLQSASVATISSNGSRFQLGSIDSARALEYHWTNSEVRRALIKSLGIDSRNILFGEKWNSSMPRFAANLGLNPLQPIKPAEIVGATHSTQMHQQLNNTNGVARAGGSVDVPAVDFDWTSSGLVNPLDGPKEDVRTREAEASQSGQSTADASTPPPDTTNADPCSEDGEDNANCSSADGAATTTATSSAAATKTLPPIVPADSVGNGIHNNGNDTHLGFHPGGIFECSDRAAAGRRGDADGWDHGRNQINSGNAQEWDNKEAFGFSSGIQVGLDKDVGEENVNDGIDDEVVTTSTFSGPLKETHIYTPSKGEGKTTMTRTGIVQPPTKVSPIDFDYEIAAAGIIIDETVVKKEYRDVEYNPGFGLHFSKTPDVAAQLAVSDIASPSKPSVSEISDVFASIDTGEATSASMVKQLKDLQPAEFDDEFSDFQSVTPTSAAAATTSSSLPIPPPPMTIVGKMKENSAKSRTGTPTFGNQMILSPAILLPQAIAIENSNPKIEWGGDSAVNNIDPEELARIEELFPQPLSKNAAAATKTNDTNKSQRSTPTHNGRKQNHTPSISAAIAHKEQQHSGANDDDDWSDFVSVPAVAVATSNTQPLSHSNNNHLMQAATAAGQQHHHHSPSSSVAQQHNRQQFVTYSPQKLSKAQASLTSSNSNNDDEWSDFVSSAPPPANAPSQFRTNAPPLPQFNSAAWQNANFYNNPLSFYHQSHTSHVPNTNSDVLCQQKFQNNNNNINQYLSNRQQHQPRPQQPPAPQLQPQKIQIMQDFSTAAPSTQHPRFKVNNSSQNVSISSQYQVGSAKVSPSISLIPDLGFVAPTIAHTAFINNLPKPSFQTTKK